MKKLFLVLFFVIGLANQAVADDKYNLLCPNGTYDALEKAGYVPEIDISCLNNASVRFSNPDADMMLVSYAMKRSDLIDTKKVAVLFFENGEISVLSPWFMNLKYLETYLRKNTSTPFTDKEYSNINLENFTNAKIISNDSKYCIEYEFKFPFKGKLLQCPTKEAYAISGQVDYAPNSFSWSKALEYYLKANNQSQFKYNDNGLVELSMNFWNGYHNSSLISVNSEFQQVEYYLFKEQNQFIEKNLFVKVFPDGRTYKLYLPLRGFYTSQKYLWNIESCFLIEKNRRQCQKIADNLPFIEAEHKDSVSMPKLPVFEQE